MQMEIGALFDKPLLFLLGVVWLGIHIVLLWLVGRLLNVPFFYFAIGSQSHIGGPASAPVVASAFHRSLAPVGALLGTLGYATGTVLAYFTGLMLRGWAGACLNPVWPRWGVRAARERWRCFIPGNRGTTSATPGRSGARASAACTAIAAR